LAWTVGSDDASSRIAPIVVAADGPGQARRRCFADQCYRVVNSSALADDVSPARP